jgi:taurine transport system substrate-binding protein
MKSITTFTRVVAVTAGIGVAAAVSGCTVQSGRGEQNRTTAQTVPCPVAPDPSVTGPIRVGYQHIPNGDLIVKDADLLHTCLPNADIQWTQFSSGADVVRAFGSNSLDLGLMGSAPAAKALSEPLNLDVRVVWIQDVIGAAESLAVHDKSITSIEGLAGKRIGVPFGSTSHLSLQGALAKANMSNDVTVINLEPSAIAGAWQGGQIDAAWVWEPTLSELVKTGHVIMTAEDTATAGSPTFDLEGARGQFVTENPQVMRIWTAAQDWAVSEIRDNRESAVTRLAGQLGVEAEQVDGQLDGYIYLDASEQAQPDYLGGGLATDIRNTAEFLKGQSEIDGVNPTQTYAAAVYAEAARDVGKK